MKIIIQQYRHNFNDTFIGLWLRRNYLPNALKNSLKNKDYNGKIFIYSR
jgi:hypothetical protein